MRHFRRLRAGIATLGSGRAWHQAVACALLMLHAADAFAQQPAETAAAEDERIPVEAIRADFHDLYSRLRSAHFDLYARVSRRDYDRLFRRTLAELRRPETRFEVARRFQRFVAFGRVAHARIDSSYGAWEAFMANGGRAFPLTLRVVDGRAFVVGNRSGLDSIAVGDEVTRLNGRPIGEWLALGARNLSADTPYLMGALMELDLPMLLWLEGGERSEFEVELRRADGRLSVVAVPTRTRDEMRAASQAPRLDLSGRDARMLTTEIAYLRPGPFYNVEAAASAPYDNSGFRRFIDEAFDRFLLAGAETLIVDLRENPGGDSSFSDLMVSWFATAPYRFNSAFRIKVSPEAVESNRLRLEAPGSGDSTGVSRRFAELYAGAAPGSIVEFDTPMSSPRIGRRFTGQVYVLVNRNSYSNAVAVAATIQDHGFGTIIGEETSDLATTYGAMESFTLPRTGIVVGFPKAEIVRPNGSMAARGVIPDLSIATPLHEGPEDPVLGQALALISTRTP